MTDFVYDGVPAVQFAHPQEHIYHRHPRYRHHALYHPAHFARHPHLHPRLVHRLHRGDVALAPHGVTPEEVEAYGVDPELAPEWAGSRLWNSGVVRGWRNSAANHAPSWGGRAGQWLGSQAGRGLAHYLRPSDADPYAYALAAAPDDHLETEGFFGGGLGRAAGGFMGRAIGGAFGHGKTGGRIGRAVGGFAGSFLPFDAAPGGFYVADAAPGEFYAADAAPMMVAHDGLEPEGYFGGKIGGFLGNKIGGAIGGRFGHSNLGGRIGGWAGRTAGSFLPFDAAPGEFYAADAGPGEYYVADAAPMMVPAYGPY